MQDTLVGIYGAAIAVTVIIYVYLMLEIRRSSDGNPFKSQPAQQTQKESTSKLRNLFSFSSNDNTKKKPASVRAQIHNLEQKLYSSDDANERSQLLEQIKDLEKQ